MAETTNTNIPRWCIHNQCLLPQVLCQDRTGRALPGPGSPIPVASGRCCLTHRTRTREACLLNFVVSLSSPRPLLLRGRNRDAGDWKEAGHQKLRTLPCT